MLIALGTCATAGGVQALRNFLDAGELAADCVRLIPEYLNYLQTSKPLSDYVKPDLQLWGCPVNKGQVLEVITALLGGSKTQPSGPHGVHGLQASGDELRDRG